MSEPTQPTEGAPNGAAVENLRVVSPPQQSAADIRAENEQAMAHAAPTDARPPVDHDGHQILTDDELKRVLAGDVLDSPSIADAEQQREMEGIFGTAAEILDPSGQTSLALPPTPGPNTVGQPQAQPQPVVEPVTGTPAPAAPGAVPQVPGQPPQGALPPIGTPAPVPGQEQMVPVQGQPQPQPQQTPEMAALQATIAQQGQQISQLIEQLQARQAPPPPGAMQANEVQPVPPQWGMEIPQEYVNALRGEDPAMAQRALNAMANGLASTIHQQLRTEMSQRFEEVPGQIQSQVTASQEQQRIHDDFYGTYPELNTPQFQGMVKAVASQAAQEMGASGWSPQLRDTIAQRLAPMSPQLMQRLQAQQTQHALGGAPTPNHSVVPPQPPPAPMMAPQPPVAVPNPGVPGTPQAPVIVRGYDGQLHFAQQQPVPQPMPAGVRPGAPTAQQAEIDDIQRTLWG